MGMEVLTLTTDLQPKITVKDKSKDSYANALAEAKHALYAKMHDIMDYYCEQISLLDRSALQSEGIEMESLVFWSELMRFVSVEFEEKTSLFHKYKNAKQFDCYCMLMNYDNMQLPWPDGYKEPENRIDGLAPIGLNDNYFFFAEGGILYRLNFGTCTHTGKRIEDGAGFNRAMESVAKANHEISKHLAGVAYIREAFEKLIKAKHGNGPADTLSVMEILDSFAGILRSRPELRDYSLQILPAVDETTTNFPQQFGIYKNNEPMNLEAFFDELYF